MVLDIDPPILNLLQIDGILNFDRNRTNILKAHYIWVKNGILKIGSE